MNICLITPAAPRSRTGNRVTALRWSGILRALGHHVHLDQHYDGRPCDLLVALHARRSLGAVRCFRRRYPHRPVLLALTGTDLYGDTPADERVQRSLGLATRLIALQPRAAESLPETYRDKVRVIYQSCRRPRSVLPPRDDAFEVCVVGHLREVKNPFLASDASRRLPASSRVLVVHIGAALDDTLTARARREEASNPRYRWLGELRRADTLRRIAASRALVLTSTMEGGANVLSEAIVCGVPVLSTRIAGSIGLLGEDYPGYFPPNDADALARLLQDSETNTAFYDTLKAQCATRAPLFHPKRERCAWAALLDELADLRGEPPPG